MESCSAANRTDDTTSFFIAFKVFLLIDQIMKSQQWIFNGFEISIKTLDNQMNGRYTFRQKRPKLYSGTAHQAGESNYFCSGTAQQLFSIIRRNDLWPATCFFCYYVIKHMNILFIFYIIKEGVAMEQRFGG